MKISLDRTGGFAGMAVSMTVDTESLSLEDARELDSLVQQSGLFARNAEGRTASGRPDQYGYLLTVVDKGETFVTMVQEPDVTPEMRPLLNWLVSRARRGRRSDSPD